MIKDEVETIKKSSPNFVNERAEELRGIFPDVFTEGKIDFDKLKSALGDIVDIQPERYSFTWAGKRNATLLLQTPSYATLTPVEDESVNFENTQNLFIEGDNLEVLKLLHKSYSGRVKMIYIDPPYNTGNDFVYPDNFADPLETYLEVTGQKDVAGNLLTSNPETSGRYHSAWLSMMYPRLYLARQLLREDGVIFISIDDNEVTNLRKVMDEIFGEENFIGQIVIRSNPRGSQSIKYLASVHEYIVCYAKNFDLNGIKGEVLNDEMKSEYRYADKDGKKYRLLGLRQRGGAWRRKDRPSLFFPIFVNPDNNQVSLEKDSDFTIEVYPIKPTTSEDGSWRWSKQKVLKDIKYLVGKPVSREGTTDSWDIFQIDYLEVLEGQEKNTKTKTIWDEKEINYQNAKTEVKELFDGKDVFDFPKPVYLIKKLLKLLDFDFDDIVLDFFAGSCTTAQAVLELNREDDGNRHFAVVQLPEHADNPQFSNIADTGKERIRRVISKMVKEGESKLNLSTRKDPEDLGFRVFRLAPSNYKQWKSIDANDPEAYAQQLDMFADLLVDNWTPLNVLWEVAIKEGYGLNTHIERLEEVQDNTVWRITDPEGVS